MHKERKLLGIFIKSGMQGIILPGVKMLACKGIFATPSIDAVHVSARRAKALRDFYKIPYASIIAHSFLYCNHVFSKIYFYSFKNTIFVYFVI